MVVIKNACKIQIWEKVTKKHVPHLICCEDKKQVAVMFWGCVSSRGVEALIPVLGTKTMLNISKYFKIISYHPQHGILGTIPQFFSKIMPHAML